MLEQARVITRRRSEGDRRRTYLRLIPGALDPLAAPPERMAGRVLFVCTANSARSHLAAALWRRASSLAREELGHRAAVHWSVPDPVPAGDPASFDAAISDLSHRVQGLAPHLEATSLPAPS